jgi:hypothetical protein
MTTPATPPGSAGTYDVRVQGHLDQHWAAELGAAELTREQDGTTVLRGVTADQAALHGVLQRIRDLGVPLISVTPVPTNPATDHSL